jgi:hypothetical protein
LKLEGVTTYCGAKDIRATINGFEGSARHQHGTSKNGRLRLNKGRVLTDHRHESDQGSVANFGPATPRRTLVAVDLGGEQVSIEFKGSHFERDIILWGVRWYVTYPISYRQLEEMMEERVWKLTTRH